MYLRYKRGRDRAATKGKQKTMRIPRKLILNFLTKSYLKQADSFPMTILNSRMKSMISDLWFCMAIIMPFFLLFMILFFLIQTFIYPEIEYFQAKQVKVIESEPTQLIPDGEVIAETPAEFECIHHAIQFFWP